MSALFFPLHDLQDRGNLFVNSFENGDIGHTIDKRGV